MERVYVGIDLGSKVCAAAVKVEMGKMLEEVVFKTSEENLVGFIKRLRGEVRVLIEEGEMAGWAYRLILPHAWIAVSNPTRNAWVAKGKKKGDEVDASKLADLLRLNCYSVVYQPDNKKMANFKKAVQNYEQMVSRTSALKCQIKSMLRQQGVIVTGKAVFGAEGRKKATAEVEDETIEEMLHQTFHLLDAANYGKTRAKRLVGKLSKEYPVIERYKKMPGVSDVLAARFVAYVQDPYRFNKRTLWSFSRLGVVKRSSDGVPIGREHLDKGGNGALKDLSRKAFGGAMRTRRDNGIKYTYRMSKARTGNHTHARLNTQRKILAIMLAMWRYQTEYSDDLLTGKGLEKSASKGPRKVR